LAKESAEGVFVNGSLIGRKVLELVEERRNDPGLEHQPASDVHSTDAIPVGGSTRQLSDASEVARLVLAAVCPEVGVDSPQQVRFDRVRVIELASYFIVSISIELRVGIFLLLRHHPNNNN